jgi:tetratricopeptide (TPR) repeat protein
MLIPGALRLNKRAAIEESLSLHQSLGDKPGIANSLQGLGRIAFRQADYERASAAFEESLALVQELENRTMSGHALNNLGLIAQQQGDYSQAVSLLTEYRDIAQELGIKRSIAIASNNLGYVELYMGNYERAEPLLEESLYLFEELGDKVTSISPRINLGYLALGHNDHVRARLLFQESLTLSSEFGTKRQLAECLEGLAGVNVAQGQPEHAARLLGAADGLREAICDPLRSFERLQYERTANNIRSMLGDEPFASARAIGRAMSLEQVIAYTLEKGPRC